MEIKSGLATLARISAADSAVLSTLGQWTTALYMRTISSASWADCASVKVGQVHAWFSRLEHIRESIKTMPMRFSRGGSLTTLRSFFHSETVA
eukprot:4932068-Pyramimonas_sp.AAC.1